MLAGAQLNKEVDHCLAMAMMFVGTQNLLTQTMYYWWSKKQKMTFRVILAHFS